MELAVSTHDIAAAARRIAPRAIVTPLLESELLNRELGCRLLLKAESLQVGGSFKFRGAFNKISLFAGQARASGVVAFSSGNHAQGVAAAACFTGCRATIVVPEDAPAVKVAATRAWGAEVVFYDRTREDREAIAAALAETTGALLIPSFDDPDVIAGQGTVGAEILAQAARADVRPDAIVVPVGGGGLIAGIATAVKAADPAIQVFGVEPTGFDDCRLSLSSGERRPVPAPTPADIGKSVLCDALGAPVPGQLTFPIIREKVSGIAVMDDDAVRRAMAIACHHFHLVLEPSGAIGLAAAAGSQSLFPVRGRTILVVASGGNVDPDILTAALAAGSGFSGEPRSF